MLRSIVVGYCCFWESGSVSVSLCTSLQCMTDVLCWVQGRYGRRYGRGYGRGCGCEGVGWECGGRRRTVGWMSECLTFHMLFFFLSGHLLNEFSPRFLLVLQPRYSFLPPLSSFPSSLPSSASPRRARRGVAVPGQTELLGVHSQGEKGERIDGFPIRA